MRSPVGLQYTPRLPKHRAKFLEKLYSNCLKKAELGKKGSLITQGHRHKQLYAQISTCEHSPHMSHTRTVWVTCFFIKFHALHAFIWLMLWSNVTCKGRQNPIWAYSLRALLKGSTLFFWQSYAYVCADGYMEKIGLLECFMFTLLILNMITTMKVGCNGNIFSF